MAGTLTKSLRIPRETIDEIESQFRGRDFSSVANELLAEALKMRRCPGIIFVDGPTGRRARISGSPNDVWLVIAAYKSVEQDWESLQEAYHWLTENQLKAALNYYQCYPEEIDTRIQANEAITPEPLWERYPFTRPPNDEVLPRRRSQSGNRRHTAKKQNRRR